MTYQDERNGEEKTAKILRLIDGDTTYRIEMERGEFIITKTNFNDSTLVIKPKVGNQIAFK